VQVVYLKRLKYVNKGVIISALGRFYGKSFNCVLLSRHKIFSYFYIRAVGGQSAWRQCRNIANSQLPEFSRFQLQYFMF